MPPSRLASELARLADDAHAVRERLRDLQRQVAELRARLDKPAAAASPGEQTPARKLSSVS